MQDHINPITETRGDITIKILLDESNCEDPYEGDDAVVFLTTRNRYFVVEREGFSLQNAIDGEYASEYDSFTVYAYIHSGVALSLSPFSCPWDSGPIGCLLVRRDDFTDTQAAAKSVVDTYDAMARGNVWGYSLERGDEDLDLCFGFFCEPDGEVLTEARRQADYILAQEG